MLLAINHAEPATESLETSFGKTSTWSTHYWPAVDCRLDVAYDDDSLANSALLEGRAKAAVVTDNGIALLENPKAYLLTLDAMQKV
jgi:hypothetical protein